MVSVLHIKKLGGRCRRRNDNINDMSIGEPIQRIDNPHSQQCAKFQHRDIPAKFNMLCWKVLGRRMRWVEKFEYGQRRYNIINARHCHYAMMAIQFLTLTTSFLLRWMTLGIQAGLGLQRLFAQTSHLNNASNNSHRFDQKVLRDTIQGGEFAKIATSLNPVLHGI